MTQGSIDASFGPLFYLFLKKYWSEIVGRPLFEVYTVYFFQAKTIRKSFSQLISKK